jgi:hypothetical protein
MVQTPSKPLTLEEFLQLPETKPASEFINGQENTVRSKESAFQPSMRSSNQSGLLAPFQNYVARLMDGRSFLILLYFSGIEFRVTIKEK